MWKQPTFCSSLLTVYLQFLYLGHRVRLEDFWTPWWNHRNWQSKDRTGAETLQIKCIRMNHLDSRTFIWRIVLRIVQNGHAHQRGQLVISHHDAFILTFTWVSLSSDLRQTDERCTNTVIFRTSVPENERNICFTKIGLKQINKRK